MYPDQIGKNWSWVEQNAINRGNYQNKNQSYSQHEKYDFG